MYAELLLVCHIQNACAVMQMSGGSEDLGYSCLAFCCMATVYQSSYLMKAQFMYATHFKYQQLGHA